MLNPRWPPQEIQRPPERLEDEPGFFSKIGNFLNGDDARPPQERTIPEDEMAEIERRIKDTDIDFKEELKGGRITLTKGGIKAWDEIKNAVRDGTIPLEKYNSKFLRQKLEQDGFFTMEDQDPLRFGDQLVTPSKPHQDDFGGKERPPAQPPIGGPMQFDRKGRPIPMGGGGIGDFFKGWLFPPQQDSGVTTKPVEPKIPDPVDCVVDVAPWSDEGWVDNCDTHGVWVRSRQRPAKMTPPQYGGKPCPDYSELPPSVEERPCDPVDAKWKWSDWRECGEDGPSGIQVRTTILGEEAKYGGKPYEYQKETRECTMPSIVPEPTPVSYPMDEEDPQNAIENQEPVSNWWEDFTPFANLTGWIDFTDGTLSETPVQVDGGTSQDSLIPEQTTPVAPAETTPVVTEEPAETTVVVEEEPDCGFSEGAWGSWGDCGSGEYPGNYQSRSKLISSTNKDPMCNEYVSDEASKIKQPLSDAAWDSQSSDNFGGVSYTNDEGVYVHEIFHSRKCTPPAPEEIPCCPDCPDGANCGPCAPGSVPCEPTVVETLTEGVTTVVDGITDIFTPTSTTETPSPVIVDVNIVQQPASSGGGGGAPATTPAATTTETTEEEEETTTEEPEEGSNGLKIVGGLAVLSGIGYWAYKKYA